jgi:hypothetical protein
VGLARFRSGGEGQAVVFGEVSGLGARLPEGLFEPPGGVFRDVLVKGPGGGPRGEDALDGVMLEGAVGGGVAEGGVEIRGGVALA